VAYIPFFFYCWVEGDGVVMVVRADIPMVGVTTGDEAAGKGMTFRMRTITFRQVNVATTMTIGASTSKLSVWELVLNSPTFFIPQTLGFQFSCLSIDRQT
jgi:hypothetical protein